MTEVKENDSDTINRLSKLSSFEYDRVRNKEAESLGILVTTLDDAVKKAKIINTNTPSNHLKTNNALEPWAETVDGGGLLTVTL